MSEIHYIEENIPHRVSEVICINCKHRWIAVRPCKNKLKDLALTWKDVALLININEDINNEEAMTQVHSNKEHYEEVLKRFNDMFFH